MKSKITRSKQDYDRYKSSSDSLIYTDADEENVEDYSIEVTLGQGWNETYSDKNRNLIKIEDNIIVRGHASIVVEVAEEIFIPYNRYGIVLPTGSLFLGKGVLIASAKIEPAFQGKLILRLFNTTNNKQVLQKGDKLGSLVFFRTETTKQHNPIYRKSEISILPKTMSDNAVSWLKSNKNLWIGWLVTSTLGTFIGFSLNYFLYYKPLMDMQNKRVESQISPNRPSSHENMEGK